MSLTLAEKKEVVREVHEIATNAYSAVAAEYTGLTVAQMTELRSRARAADVHVRVVKNTLAKLAFEGTDFECMKDSLVGPLLLVFSSEDPGASARLVRDFAKENEKLVAKAVVFGGELRGPEGLSLLANLPTLDEARAKLLSVFNAPATQLVRTMAEPAGQMVRVLAAYRDANESA